MRFVTIATNGQSVKKLPSFNKYTNGFAKSQLNKRFASQTYGIRKRH